MAAKRGAQFLYHASDTEFNPGDSITPQNYSHAFASSDRSVAEPYGKHVYEVEPIDRKEARARTSSQKKKWANGSIPDWAKTVSYSVTGFRVIKRHGDGTKDPKDA
jgi:hypothetical protein